MFSFLAYEMCFSNLILFFVSRDTLLGLFKTDWRWLSHVNDAMVWTRLEYYRVYQHILQVYPRSPKRKDFELMLQLPCRKMQTHAVRVCRQVCRDVRMSK